MDSKHNQTEPYSYEKAGVSIEAGNALIKAIAPLARATARPGAGGPSSRVGSQA